MPDEELEDSDLILPDADATLDEVQDLLSDSDEGLVPNEPTRPADAPRGGQLSLAFDEPRPIPDPLVALPERE